MQPETSTIKTASLPGLAVPLSGVLFGHGLRLLHDPDSQRSAVFLDGTALFAWHADDAASERLVMAQIVNAKLASQTEVAQVFGVHRNTVARVARQVETEGVGATSRRKPGPRRPHKVTAEVRAELERAVEAGLSSYAAQRQLQQRLGVALSQSHVDRLLRQLKNRRGEQLVLGLGDQAKEMATSEEQAEAATLLTTSEVEPSAGAAVGTDEGTMGPEGTGGSPGAAWGCQLEAGESVSSRYLGLTLFSPALVAVGLLTIAEQV